jgi:putative ATP-dependent endonuclease of OLD family
LGEALQLTGLKIENFRALKNVEIPLSDFGCLIGENNAGKSSVLNALILLLTGSTPRKLSATDFYDPNKPIRIELQITSIEPGDLDRISDSGHRASLEKDVVGHQLTLVRTVPVDLKKEQLKIRRLGPKDENLTDEVLGPAMKNKSGAELRQGVVALIPALEARLGPKPTQTQIRNQRDLIIDALPKGELILRDADLGTGIEAAIRSFLPEPIYIEAVKDVANDVKTSDTAIFGKLLKILLDEVSDQFSDVNEHFKSIQSRLSRIEADGVMHDNRLAPVKLIESTIEEFVRQSFPGIDLKMSVPVPELKTIFSAAEITVDDGHEGPITGKGDGLKRTVAFAILRAYTVLRTDGLGVKVQPAEPKPMYLLLFEEPELYLHPRAQRQLFRALELFSTDHPVLVTTHSPLFVGAESTTTFTKMRKVPGELGGTPESKPLPVDLLDKMDDRTAFQIICHENNEHAFFAQSVVLVEGESDAILFAHLARLFNREWDHVERNVAFVQIGGKQNFTKYRAFFEKFDIDVHILCDLDTVIDGHQHLFSDERRVNLRSRLMARVDELSKPETLEIAGKQASKLRSSGSIRGHWADARQAFVDWDRSPEGFVAIDSSLTAFFSNADNPKKLEVLKGIDEEVKNLKHKLLKDLRNDHVYVFLRGALEDYYGSFEDRGKSDKVRHAIKLRDALPDRRSFEALHEENLSEIMDELTSIMEHMFESMCTTKLLDEESNLVST